MKKLLFSFLLLTFSLVVNAEKVQIEGIWYNLIEKAQQAEVIKAPEGTEYTGDVVIPEKVTYNELDYNVTRIGDNAFDQCTGLTNIIIPNSVTSIGGYTFYNCSSLTNITFPNTLKNIGESAFSLCSGLTNITFPNTLKNIGESAFSGCSGLTNITIPNSVTSIERYTFNGCSSLTNITIPNSVTSIGDYAFEFTGLTNIIIPNSVTSLGWGTFVGCSNLTNITIPNSIEEIVPRLFESCSELSTINLPSSVKSINSKAFSNCKNLTDIYCHAKEVPTIASDAFLDSYVEYATLHVPDSSYYDYKEADVWKDFGTITTLSGNIPAYTHNLIYMVDSVEYKKVAMDYKTAITLDDAPIKEGHTFSGWSNAPQTMPLHDVIVTGSFTINNYNLIYFVDSVEYKKYEVTYGDTLVAEAEPTKEGYTFSGWSEVPATMPANDVTIEGQFSVNYYQVTYMVDSTVYAVDTLAYNSNITLKENLVKEGYTFSGWSEAPSTMPANDIIINGSFTINTYNLTYNVDGVEYQKYEVTYGDTLVAEAEPTKEGYTFSGWSEVPATMPANDVTIEGQFSVNYYQVTYMLDGEIFQIDSLAYGEAIVIPEAPAKEDYEFNGWSEAPETMPAGDLTVTGTYTLLVYCETPTISYKDGKLTFECATEGAECVTNIVSEDFLEHIGSEMELTLTYQVNVYAKAEGYAKSPVTIATICWIECDHKSDAHGVEAIPATVVLIKADNGIVTIQGLEKGTPVAVYTTAGTEVANGVAEEDTILTLDTRMQKGDVVIVKMGNKSVKVVIK
ncbi:MAG: leucine-rich repeat protein [Bacteroidaceae bacterium]|nr:leucine-rich repeat protein [Bacteroidaceae bacterium]